MPRLGSQYASGSLGMAVVQHPDEKVVVRHVPPNTPAYAAGIREGDELEGVQGKVFQPGVNALELMKELDGPFQSSVELAIRGGPSAELRQLRLVRAQPEAYEGVLRDALSTLSRASSPLSVQDSPTSVEGGRSMLGRRFSSSDDESDADGRSPVALAAGRSDSLVPQEAANTVNSKGFRVMGGWSSWGGADEGKNRLSLRLQAGGDLGDDLNRAPSMGTQREAKQIAVVREMLSTERTYVRTLDISIRFFYEPLLELSRGSSKNKGKNIIGSFHNPFLERRMSDDSKSGSSPQGRKLQGGGQFMLDEQRIHNMFGRLKELHKLHLELLMELQHVVDNMQGAPQIGRIAEIFVALTPHLEVYIGYINNHAFTMAEIEQLNSSSSELAAFLTQQSKAASWEANSAEARTEQVEPVAPHARAREVLLRFRAIPNQIRDRRKHMRKYRMCFSGSDFISWAVSSELCASRTSGVELGQLLLDQNLVFRVDVAKSVFKDKNALYRCFADEAQFAKIAEDLRDKHNELMEGEHDDLIILKGLRDAAILRVLPKQALAILSESCQLLTFQQGDAIIEQGIEEDDEAMYIIVTGTVGVYVSGVPHAVTYMSAGRFFGEMSLLTGKARSATIKAEEVCRLIEVTRSSLAPLLEAMPQLADQIAEVITMRRYEAQRRATLLVSEQGVGTSRQLQQSRTIAESKELSAKVRSFFGMQPDTSQPTQLDSTLQGLLIAPVQRIPRYILLIKELQKWTDDETSDHAGLERALKALLSQADHINTSKKASDDLYAVLQIQNRIVGLPCPLVMPSRSFIQELSSLVVIGWPHNTDKESHQVFVFNNLLVLAQLTSTGERNADGSSRGKCEYMAMMETGPWTTFSQSKLFVTVHMEEVTWAFFYDTEEEVGTFTRVVKSAVAAA